MAPPTPDAPLEGASLPVMSPSTLRRTILVNPNPSSINPASGSLSPALPPTSEDRRLLVARAGISTAQNEGAPQFSAWPWRTGSSMPTGERAPRPDGAPSDTGRLVLAFMQAEASRDRPLGESDVPRPPRETRAAATSGTGSNRISLVRRRTSPHSMTTALGTSSSTVKRRPKGSYPTYCKPFAVPAYLLHSNLAGRFHTMDFAREVDADEARPTVSTRRVDSILLPTCWESKDRSVLIDLGTDGLDVCFAGAPKSSPSGRQLQ